ncbi:MAG: hypothetical protein V6Z86_02265 [Hyphomicrobiales bacterium]
MEATGSTMETADLLGTRFKPGFEGLTRLQEAMWSAAAGAIGAMQLKTKK